MAEFRAQHLAMLAWAIGEAARPGGSGGGVSVSGGSGSGSSGGGGSGGRGGEWEAGLSDAGAQGAAKKVREADRKVQEAARKVLRLVAGEAAERCSAHDLANIAWALAQQVGGGLRVQVMQRGEYKQCSRLKLLAMRPPSLRRVGVRCYAAGGWWG